MDYIGEFYNGAYIINKNKLSVNQLDEIYRDLTVQPMGFDLGEKFKIYQETQHNIIIPKFYGLKKFGFDTSKIIPTNKINIKFKGKLRDYQIDISKTIIDSLKKTTGGIMSLYCGGGKTTITLDIICQLNLRALIMVHKSFLLNQWYDRIRQFTTASIGTIRQNKTDINHDIVIGMIQSICKRDYNPKIFENFDIIIIDECHHIASRVFSQALFKIPAKYTIGLSATPDRGDGLTHVIKLFLGDIAVKLERSSIPQVETKIFNYKSSDILFAEKTLWYKKKFRPDIIKMVSNLSQINSRNQFILKIIESIIKSKNRKMVVFSARVSHAKLLKSLTDNLIQKYIQDNIFIEDEVKTGLYIGRLKDYQLTDAAESDIIFATDSMAEEGLDIENLNTILYTTPKKKVIQSNGRILRKPISDYEINPLIIDIADQLSVFCNWKNIREAEYSKLNFNIENYFAYNSEFINIKNYLILFGINKNPKNPAQEFILNNYDADFYEMELQNNFAEFPKKYFDQDINLDHIFQKIDYINLK